MFFRSALAAASLLLCVTAHAAANNPEGQPRLAPGLWEMKNTLPSLGGITQITEICMGPDGGDFTEQAARNSKDCPQKTFRNDGDRVIFDAVCKAEGSMVTVHGEFTGDFSSRYTADIRTTYDPPLQGVANMTLSQESRRIGDCAQGQKPGDMVMKSMGNVNVQQLLKNLQKMPAR